MERQWTSVVLLLVVAAIVPSTLAYGLFRDRIPNGNVVPHPCKKDTVWYGVGHLLEGGRGARNSFGHDFHDAGNRWTTELCNKDSDGDGRTNGQELGDPKCVWKEGDVPSTSDNLSHPGVCEPVWSDTCIRNTEFVECDNERPESCPVRNEPDVTTQELMFEPTDVPATETNYYCQTFMLPDDQDYHIVAQEAIVDNVNVLHHMVLYGCDSLEKKRYATPSSCGMNDDYEMECNSVLTAWSFGDTTEYCLGDKVGIRVGPTGYKMVKLEIHWNNPESKAGYRDSSGLRLFLRPARPEVQDLVTFVVGPYYMKIPPGQSHHEEIGVCGESCTYGLLKESAYVVSVFNHMHLLGKEMKVEIYRGGMLYRTISHDHHFVYDSPVTHVHDPPVELKPGDEIKTTCVYNSLHTDHYVYNGEATNEEMCYGFISLYPASAFWEPEHYCLSYGPLDECQLYLEEPYGECDWASFANLSIPESAMRYHMLKKNCNLDGLCRPECRAVSEEIKKHPCLNGDIAQVTVDYLVWYKEGVDFLGRLHSCPSYDHCKDQCSMSCPDEEWGKATNAAGNMVDLRVTLTSLLLLLAAILF